MNFEELTTSEQELILKRNFLAAYAPKEVIFEGLKCLSVCPGRQTLYNQRPSCSGVYFFVSIGKRGDYEILYIGSTRRFSVRFSESSALKKIAASLPKSRFLEILCFPCKNYLEQERIFIRKYCPLYNKHHNPKYKINKNAKSTRPTPNNK